jgi:hypothetical protein
VREGAAASAPPISTSRPAAASSRRACISASRPCASSGSASSGSADAAGEAGEADGAEKGKSVGGSGAGHKKMVTGSDDDIVARRLRKAAEDETDPELKERLWKEYYDYKKSASS